MVSLPVRSEASLPSVTSYDRIAYQFVTLWPRRARRRSRDRRWCRRAREAKGLLAYDTATGGVAETRAARRAGEEYLLQRGLFRRLSTGRPVAPWVNHFCFPFRWAYNVLNAADYFRESSILDSADPDRRMAEAIEFIRAARQPDRT